MTDDPVPGVTRPEAPITSPERIRALAHPLRLELLDHLGDVITATATECAEAVGESVASCSFHLRMLEKYGFIERAERRGREKPWRVTQTAGFEMRPTPEEPDSYAAIAQIGAMEVLRESERIQRFLAQLPHEDEAWGQGSTISQSSFWATAEELKQLSTDLRELVRRFDGRAEDPAQRPPGARRARLFGVVNPDPILDHLRQDGHHHHD